MSLRRVSVLAALVLSCGSAVALINSNPFLSQAIAQSPAQSPEGQPGDQRRSDRKAQLMRELNLTPEQTQRLQTIQSQYRNQTEQRNQAVRQAHQELIDLMAGTAPENQIREKYRQVETLKQQAAEVRFTSLLAMREVLTPEQRRQFAEGMQNRRDNYQHRDKNRDNFPG